MVGEGVRPAGERGRARPESGKRLLRCLVAFAVLAALAALSSGCLPHPKGSTAPEIANPPAPTEVIEPPPTPSPQPRVERFEATAYSFRGKTASGSRARKGIVAADPRILPMGTRVRVEGAGAYDGEYVVEDTGRGIKGREIDIYVPSRKAARRFGRKQVRVEVLEEGTSPPSAP